MNERFLCIAHEFPFPIDSGSVSRYLPMLTFLAERGPVRLVVNLRTSTTPADVARLEQQTGATVAAGGRLYEPIERKAALWAKALIERKPPWFAMWEDADLLLRVEANLDWATHVVALDDFAAQYLLRLKPRGRWLVIDKHKVYAAPTAVGEPRTDPIGRLRDRLTLSLIHI